MNIHAHAFFLHIKQNLAPKNCSIYLFIIRPSEDNRTSRVPGDHSGGSSPSRRWWLCRQRLGWYPDPRRVYTAGRQIGPTQAWRIDQWPLVAAYHRSGRPVAQTNIWGKVNTVKIQVCLFNFLCFEWRFILYIGSLKKFVQGKLMLVLTVL